jgi:hypothetical protein
MLRRRTATETELTPARYDELVRRIRSIVMEVIRPGARILVVSRGDDELLRFGNRVAWHFPRLDNGSYAGYHPASSEAAIEHLEAMRELGAQYLLLPSPSYWWRGYYQHFFEHLGRNGTVIWNDDACAVFALEGSDSRRTAPSPLARPLERLLDALLPQEATVAVLSSGDSSLLAAAGRRTLHLPRADDGRYAGELGACAALEQLAELGQNGATFLVVPHVAPAWVDGYPEFLEEVEARYTCIARRQRVCTVYELGEPFQP